MEPLLPGWHSLDPARPALIGSRCTACGTVYFPAQDGFCRHPDCQGEDFERLELSRRGTLWSYTNAGYPPPPPYVAREPYRPFAIAAVELEQERMIVLGPVVDGVEVGALEVGMTMELAIEAVAVEAGERLTWKWKPVA